MAREFKSRSTNNNFITVTVLLILEYLLNVDLKMRPDSPEGNFAMGGNQYTNGCKKTMLEM